MLCTSIIGTINFNRIGKGREYCAHRRFVHAHAQLFSNNGGKRWFTCIFDAHSPILFPIESLMRFSIYPGTLYYSILRFRTSLHALYIQESGVEEVQKFSTVITFCKQLVHEN